MSRLVVRGAVMVIPGVDADLVGAWSGWRRCGPEISGSSAGLTARAKPEERPKTRATNLSEPFPNWIGLTDRQYVNGVGDFPTRRGPRRFSAESVPFQAARLTYNATRFCDRASGGSEMTLKKLDAALAAAGLAAGA